MLQRLLRGESAPGADYLDTPLLRLSKADTFTIRDACEGVQIFGGIGSGKTSGSGAALARAFLLAGFGGLVCCAKSEERALWEQYARETGREASLTIIRPGEQGEEAPWRFNFLEYELRRAGAGGGLSENVVNLLTQVVEIVQGRQGTESDGGFWTRSANALLRNAVDLLALAAEPLTLQNICRVILDAPETRQQSFDAKWQKRAYTFGCLRHADEQPKSSRELNDYAQVVQYWLEEYPGIPDRTRGSINATFQSVADMILHGVAWELLGRDSNIVPETTYKNGLVIVLDLSIQEYREVGRVVQSIWKTLFQQAVLRRNIETDPTPVFLWCDEAQSFVTTFDYEYLATARSARACTVYLTQNISNYHARLGQDAKSQVDALLGLFQTKIFHANGDYATNQYAADLIGQKWTTTGSWSVQSGSGSRDDASHTSSSYGQSESVQYKVLPTQFAALRKGGPANENQVEAVVFQGGRMWRASDDTYICVVFPQSQQS